MVSNIYGHFVKWLLLIDPHLEKEDQGLEEAKFLTGEFLLHLIIAVLSDFNIEYD